MTRKAAWQLRTSRSGQKEKASRRDSYLAQLVKLEELVRRHKNKQRGSLNGRHDVGVRHHVVGELVALQVPAKWTRARLGSKRAAGAQRAPVRPQVCAATVTCEGCEGHKWDLGAHLTFSCFSLMISVRFLPSTCSW